MNLILSNSFPAHPTAWPLCVPVEHISCHAIVQVVDFLGLAEGEKAWLFISRCASLYLHHISEEWEIAQTEESVDFRYDDGIPRHDFVMGDWVQRQCGTPEYLYACYEDALFWPDGDKRRGAVLRFRRVMTLESPRFYCVEPQVSPPQPPPDASPPA